MEKARYQLPPGVTDSKENLKAFIKLVLVKTVSHAEFNDAIADEGALTIAEAVVQYVEKNRPPQ